MILQAAQSKNFTLSSQVDPKKVRESVYYSIKEDLGLEDITASLIDHQISTTAHLIVREQAILCGIPWFNMTYEQIDPEIQIHWQKQEGHLIQPNTCIAILEGNARHLLTAERVALNWLQTLSATATQTYHYVEKLKNTTAKLRDTRKTIPGLRYAQKYAVRIGGGYNHRQGLYDAFLIKENHIACAGSIKNAIKKASSSHPEKLLEIEVETLEELKEALHAGGTLILLDNFDLPLLKEAVTLNAGRAKLEASGNINLNNLEAVGATGVDYIAIGSLTKHIQAIDFSIRMKPFQ